MGKKVRIELEIDEKLYKKLLESAKVIDTDIANLITGLLAGYYDINYIINKFEKKLVELFKRKADLELEITALRKQLEEFSTKINLSRLESEFEKLLNELRELKDNLELLAKWRITEDKDILMQINKIWKSISKVITLQNKIGMLYLKYKKYIEEKI